MKHAKRIGLQSDYIEDSETHRIIRQFMALPLLPEEHILSNFERIRTHIPDSSSKLLNMADYILSQWLSNDTYGVSGISVFNEEIRTNNDCEGWHLRLKKIAKQVNIPMYNLISILYDEAKHTEVVATMVYLKSDKKVQKKKYETNNRNMMRLFGSYSRNEITPDDLLTRGSYLINPRENILSDNE